MFLHRQLGDTQVQQTNSRSGRRVQGLSSDAPAAAPAATAVSFLPVSPPPIPLLYCCYISILTSYSLFWNICVVFVCLNGLNPTLTLSTESSTLERLKMKICVIYTLTSVTIT